MLTLEVAVAQTMEVESSSGLGVWFVQSHHYHYLDLFLAFLISLGFRLAGSLGDRVPLIVAAWQPG